tara:strand:+ start:250 stop:933 length:684 start_codon:yes stop_codon:yes gene_type:complete
MVKRFQLFLEDLEPLEPLKAEQQPTIVFTDVVKSSELWADDPKLMEERLDNHFNLINEKAKNWGGFVVKTIGDSFMIYFEPTDNSLLEAINCSIDIINDEELDLRIGVCYGKMREREYMIQNAKLKDYFGNAVNTASRLESKVCDEPNCISFSNTDDITQKQSADIFELLENYEFTKIKYSDDCSKDKENIGKRSGRLLTNLDIEECRNIQDLKGVKDIVAYKFNVK